MVIYIICFIIFIIFISSLGPKEKWEDNWKDIVDDKVDDLYSPRIDDEENTKLTQLEKEEVFRIKFAAMSLSQLKKYREDNNLELCFSDDTTELYIIELMIKLKETQESNRAKI
ncbi:hypothetical protein N9597_00115 [Candidatus Marinimicrobia bacterium]|nr:hypothetical protein [Candidatus Neomarinimicrobiota bacterium]